MARRREENGGGLGVGSRRREGNPSAETAQRGATVPSWASASGRAEAGVAQASRLRVRAASRRPCRLGARRPENSQARRLRYACATVRWQAESVLDGAGRLLASAATGWVVWSSAFRRQARRIPSVFHLATPGAFYDPPAKAGTPNLPRLPRGIARWWSVGLLVALLCACAAGAAEVTHGIGGETMGTTWSVKFRGAEVSPQSRDGHRDAVQAELDRLEAQMSDYRAESVVSRFNRERGTNWFAVPVETARVVREALEISRRTEGAFDITVGPLVALWGFGPRRKTGVVPTAEAIAAARARVGWRWLEVRGTPAGVEETVTAGVALRKGIPDLEIDLGGIAKGFAAEVVSELLARRGLTNHLVGIGGDLRARGAGPAGEGWRVGIERPGAGVAGAEVVRVLALRDGALSTSGNYRNFFTVGGRRYGHIIDPRTGWPVAADVAGVAVSVVAKSGTWADALATGLLVLGEAAAVRVAEREGVGLVIVRGDGGIGAWFRE